MRATIKSKSDFERVFRDGRHLNHRVVRLIVRPVGPASKSRYAFVAPKRFGNAVYRNRSKRVLREATRQAALPVVGFDVIVMATAQTHDSTPVEVASVLSRLGKRFGT